MTNHLYIVAYDIRNSKRRREVFTTMKGFGAWLQFSVFQCNLSAKQYVELIEELKKIVHHREDHILLMDLGPTKNANLSVESIGKEFDSVSKGPIIV